MKRMKMQFTYKKYFYIEYIISSGYNYPHMLDNYPHI